MTNIATRVDHSKLNCLGRTLCEKPAKTCTLNTVSSARDKHAKLYITGRALRFSGEATSWSSTFAARNGSSTSSSHRWTLLRTSSPSPAPSWAGRGRRGQERRGRGPILTQYQWRRRATGIEAHPSQAHRITNFDLIADVIRLGIIRPGDGWMETFPVCTGYFQAC